MISHRLHTGLPARQGLSQITWRIPLCNLWLLFFLLLFSQISLAGTGSTKAKKDSSKYDINDPKNPDCPCHKYQELADKEFKAEKTDNNKSIRDRGNTKTKLISVIDRIKYKLSFLNSSRNKLKSKNYSSRKRKKKGSLPCSYFS
jgi:hypothetical protein